MLILDDHLAARPGLDLAGDPSARIAHEQPAADPRRDRGLPAAGVVEDVKAVAYAAFHGPDPPA